MKKTLIIASILLLSAKCFSQKLGIKLDSVENVTTVPAVVVQTDTISINQIIDNGSSVVVSLFVSQSQPAMYLTLWSGAAYIANENWTNQMIIAQIKFLLNVN